MKTLAICPGCGRSNDLDRLFCPHCRSSLSRGRAVAEEEADQIESHRIGTLSKARKRNRFLKLAFLSAVLIAIVLIIWSPGNQINEPTTDLSAKPSGHSWNMYQGGPSLSGSREVSQLTITTDDAEIVWTYQAEGAISSSPAVTEESVYVSTDDRRIVALDRGTGLLLWEYPAEAPTDSSPAVAGDLLYVALREGKFVALDRFTGAEIWHFQSEEPFFSSPTIHNGIAYIGSGDKNFYAFDAITGDQIWRYNAGSRIVNAGVVNEKVVAFTTQDNVVHILDALSGDLRLDYPIGSSYSAPAMDGKLLFVTDLDGMVRAIDWTKIQYPMEKTARRFRMTMFLWGFEDTPPVMKGFVWKRRTKEVFQNTPTVGNGMIYVPSLDGSVYKLSASTGKPQWVYEAEGTISESVSVIGNTMLLGDSTGKVHGVDIESGEKVWGIQLDGHVSSTPVVSGDTLFVATQNGSIYAVK